MNNISLSFDYSVKKIKLIEKEIINNNIQWLNNIKKDKNIKPEDFLNSYLYKDSKFNYIYDSIRFLKYVSNNKEIKEASNQFDINIKKYFLKFYNSYENYKLFLILKKIKINKKSDKNNLKKLIENIFKSFKNNGVLFNKEKKYKLDKINNKLIIDQNKFSENIIKDIKYLKFKKEELNGIDDNILKDHKKNNYYIFNTTYPDKNIIMKYCENSKTREKMNNTFNNVALENKSILKNIINNRTKKSLLFGFKNNIQYFLSENRIAKEKDIYNILDRLVPILKKKVQSEYKELIKISDQDFLHDYDNAYYSNIYKKKYLNYDDKIIKEYFPSNYTLLKILNIYTYLFGVKIEFIKEDPSKYWHKDVQLYKITENKNIVGYIYLDLYPREGKYTHAATFEIKNTYRDINDNRIIPITAILCNFSPVENNKNYSLLTFSEVVTFCHELGHAFHNILSNVKYESLSGISTELDFAEAPSQLFENWCYEKDFLKKISKHHITNKNLPDNIIEKIIKNRNYMNAIHYLTQILYIKYDLNIHKNKSVDEKYLHNEFNKLSEDLLPFKNSEDTYPECRFDHIIEYGVGYYGYLFSIIYSYDAFSLFKKYGIFNQEIGKRLRKEILEKGSTIKGIDMLENFLQRKKNEKYFYQIFR